MPNILIAQEAGACFGVNRALQMVQKAVADHDGRVSTLGPLIHNPTVVAALEKSGVRVVSDPADAAGTTLVLRTHGVTPAEEARARQATDSVIDATCPFVTKAHRAAETLSAEGYQVLVLGEKGHPEVEGTLGHAEDAVVVGCVADLGQVLLRGKVGIVVQTTQTRANLREVVDALIGQVGELRVIDTICEATSLRQAAAAELAKSADVMVVIGGRNSANTCHLAEICAAKCTRTHHIELADELEASWFAGAQTIGITAGASTPQDQIDDVRSAIEALTRD